MPDIDEIFGPAAAVVAPAPALKCETHGTIAGWLGVLAGDSPVLEMRATFDGRRPVVEHFPSTLEGRLELATRARDLSRSKPDGVYYVLNALPADQSVPAKDEHVTRRQWLLVDVDPVRPFGPATDAEKYSAWLVALAIRDDLAARGIEYAAFVDSGNGYHLYYRIDVPADDGGLIRRVLHALGDRFDTPDAKVDRTVFNPSRISKLPGTIARKGTATADRPHRPTSVIEMYPPKPGDASDARTLEALADELAPAQGFEVVEALRREIAREAAAQVVAQERPAPAPRTPREATDAALAKMIEPAPDGGWTPPARASAYLARVDAAVSGANGHSTTLRAAMVGPAFDLTPEDAFRLLWAEYNPRCEPPWSEHDLRRKVAEAYKRETRRGWLVEPPTPEPAPAAALEVAATPPPFAVPSGLIEAPDDERRLARLYVVGEHGHPDHLTLVHWGGDYWIWRDGAWRMTPDRDVNAALTRAAKSEFERVALDEAKPVRPVGTRLVGNIANMLKALQHVSTHTVPRQPSWLGKPWHDPAQCLNFRNGVLHLPTYLSGDLAAAMRPPTPRYFVPSVLDYDFDPNAPEPTTWLRFLDSIWPNDPESIQALQQWFGYLLTPDTSLHSILLMLGPPRAGKSVMMNVIAKMLGSANVVAPLLSQLGTPFGCQALIGKSLAYFPEARITGRSDPQAIVERLLSVSGEDEQTIARKHQPDWVGKLPTRFVMVGNEIPNLGDGTHALMSRIILLKLNQSFIGREDRDLPAKLAAEMPGILLWAIQGWEHLNRTRRFIQPATGLAEREEMAESINPMVPFAAEELDFADDQSTDKSDLFARWLEWCRSHNRDKPGNSQTFFKRLRTHLANSGVPFAEPRPRIEGRQIRMISGVGLRPKPAF